MKKRKPEVTPGIDQTADLVGAATDRVYEAVGYPARVKAKLEAIRIAASYEFPTGEVETMLAEADWTGARGGDSRRI